jgi:hypothetical protein
MLLRADIEIVPPWLIPVADSAFEVRLSAEPRLMVPNGTLTIIEPPEVVVPLAEIERD